MPFHRGRSGRSKNPRIQRLFPPALGAFLRFVGLLLTAAAVAGAIGFLSKPFREEWLINHLDVALNRDRADCER